MDDLGVFGGAGKFVQEATSRNHGILSDEEQARLQATHLLVAGCGSVGGAIVEPLVRLGIGSLSLADPDVYETHNLNRQACLRSDLGRPKPLVLAERVRAINPLVEVQVLTEGLTVENVATQVGRASAIFDGVDPAGGALWIKYLVHKHAAARRIPVLLGADIGGKSTIFVYDYRHDARPLYGRGREEDFREGRELEAMRALNRIQAVPADFFPIIVRRATSGDAWPQVAYTAAGLGALASRIVIDLAVGRRVRHTVAADIHMATRPARDRMVERLRWPLAAASALRAVGRDRPAQRADAPPAPVALPLAQLGERLLTVGDAIRYAPSRLNEQPWRLRPIGGGGLRLEVDPRRSLPAGDPDGRWLCMSIGCAIGSARRVAELDFQASEDGGGPPLSGWHPGEIEIDELRREGLMAAFGLLRARRTDRRPYERTALPSAVLAELEVCSLSRSCQLVVREDRRSIWGASMVLCDALSASFGDRRQLEELADWTRSADGAVVLSPDGLPLDALGISRPMAMILSGAMRRPPARRVFDLAGLPWKIAGRRARNFRECGAVLLLCGEGDDPAAYLRAGEALMEIWFAAVRHGLAMEPNTSVFGNELLRRRIAMLFGLGEGVTPFALIRLGYGAGLPAPTPRLPLRRLFVSNGDSG